MNIFKITKQTSPCFVGGQDEEKNFIFTSFSDRNKTFENIQKEVFLEKYAKDIEITEDSVKYYEVDYKISWNKNDTQVLEGEFTLNELLSLY